MDILKAFRKPFIHTPSIYTHLEGAIAEINNRRNNTSLIRKVEKYLGDIIPDHFRSERPILHLARHIATPNFETLRFIELAKPSGLPVVIGEDLKDKFVSNNSLKRSLCKMSIMKGTARNGDEIMENFTIVDFARAQGKPLCEINTIFGDTLPEFHQKLFKMVYPEGVTIVDETQWVDHNRSETLFEQYKKMFALFIVHGIMFEWYPPAEESLFNNVVIPAFAFIEKEFGCRPLVCELVSEEMADDKNWESYPSIIYPFIKAMY